MTRWDSNSPSYMYIYQKVSTILGFSSTLQMPLNLAISPNIPSLSLLSLPLPHLIFPFQSLPSIHNNLFYFPFLMRSLCSLQSLTLYLPSVSLQTVAIVTKNQRQDKTQYYWSKKEEGRVVIKMTPNDFLLYSQILFSHHQRRAFLQQMGTNNSQTDAERRRPWNTQP